MNDKLKEALASLDVNNDNHWTSDGLPRVDTVKFLSGDQSLDRLTISSAFPLFTRYNTVFEATETVLPPVDAVVTITSSEPDPDLETVISETDVTTSDVDEETALRERLAKLRGWKGELDNEIAEISGKLDAIIEKQEAEPAQNAISGYLRQAKRDLQMRANARSAIAESGVDLAELAAVAGPSPIDQALSRRNKMKPRGLM